MLHDAGERRHGRDAVDVEPRDEADGQRDGGEGESVHEELRGGGGGLGKELGEGSGRISMHRRSPEASEQCVSTVAISEETYAAAGGSNVLRSFKSPSIFTFGSVACGWPFHLRTQWNTFPITPPWCFGLTGQLLRSGSGDQTDLCPP